MPTIINGTTGVDTVQDGVIQTADIANSAVTAAKIADANITPAKLTGLTVTQANQPNIPGGGTVVTFTHGLGVIPVSAEFEFVCLTAEGGYSVGDVVNPFALNASYGAPAGIRRTATLVSTVSPASWGAANATNGTFFNPTTANWAWRFKVRSA